MDKPHMQIASSGKYSRFQNPSTLTMMKYLMLHGGVHSVTFHQEKTTILAIDYAGSVC